jgi:hypothetical protein
MLQDQSGGADKDLSPDWPSSMPRRLFAMFKWKWARTTLATIDMWFLESPRNADCLPPLSLSRKCVSLEEVNPVAFRVGCA